MDAGPARRRDGQADCAREPVARDGAAALSRCRSQAVARKMWCIPQVDADDVARMEDVLDLDAEAPDPQRPSGLLRREPNPAHRRGAPADPPEPGRSSATTASTGAMEPPTCLASSTRTVLAQGEVMCVARRSTSPSACANSPTSIIRKPNASASCSTILSTHSAGALLSGLPGRAGAAPASPHRVTLRSQARQLAQHGRDRDRRPRRPMPGPSHRKLSAPHRRSRRLGEAAQWRGSPHRLELHNRKGPHQNGASLSEAHKPETAAKSQNLCAKELVGCQSRNQTPRSTTEASFVLVRPFPFCFYRG